MNRLEAMSVFTAVVEAGGYAQAAERLRVGQPDRLQHR